MRIVLPSRRLGNSDIFIGKAMVRMSGLNCTPEVMFTRRSLICFFAQLDDAQRSLKGRFELESTNSRFRLKGSVNRKGAYQVEVVCTGLHFTEPENAEWSASVSFACGHIDHQEAASMLKTEGEQAAPSNGDKPSN